MAQDSSSVAARSAAPGLRRPDFLAFSPPSIGEAEVAAVVATLRSGWITTGPKVREFEQRFAEYVGAPAALALNSCTAGLHASLVALGIKEGDEVITTPMTFAATVNVIEHVGATPVLVDIEPDTMNIDANQVSAAITPRTKVILPVHYAGHPVQLDCLRGLAEKAGATLLEDAAHAVAARYRGKLIGSGTNPTCFSFYATKNLTTCEGGMLTGDPDFLEKVRVIGLHGMSRDAWRRYEQGANWFYGVTMPGYKYNMTDMQAAMGLVQLDRLDRMQARRTEIALQYSEAFAEIDALETPVERTDVEHAWHLYVLRLNLDLLSITRAQFIEEMTARNIGTSVHFIPIYRHPYYVEKYNLDFSAFPVCEESFSRMVSLPIHPGLTEYDVRTVIDAVVDIVDEFRV
jgi:dTDP-4-amino-4,6-dideoxygalactose transaminase